MIRRFNCYAIVILQNRSLQHRKYYVSIMKPITLFFILALITFTGKAQQVRLIENNCRYEQKLGLMIKEFKSKYFNESNVFNYSDNKTSTGIKNFLNRDFKTAIFNKACFLEEANFQVKMKNGEEGNLGFMHIAFKTEKELESALKVIHATKRDSFNLKVLTKFVIVRHANGLIIISSETPFNKLVNTYFKDLS